MTTPQEFFPRGNQAKCTQDEHKHLEEHVYHLLSGAIIHPAFDRRRSRTGTTELPGTRSGLWDRHNHSVGWGLMKRSAEDTKRLERALVTQGHRVTARMLERWSQQELGPIGPLDFSDLVRHYAEVRSLYQRLVAA